MTAFAERFGYQDRPGVSQHHGMTPDKLEAIGQRGEACIILREKIAHPNGNIELHYRLATGERLRTTDSPGEFETPDGKRRFRLRDPR
ncbi:MAG TPA: hypothetical protein VLA61_11005 [Ideonella sp.]|uniref:hypothetical protein n=1 Tax=Ideonella sp. TaxID=1929293 RepID=UPI002CF866DE|nr:hypothetical protein [Ideonella sp.]HSI48791.1 hypothetical protein [Ideonella sp.]